MPTLNIKSKNDERLEARISLDKKVFLKHAADLAGRTLTDFVINAAYEAATRLIKEHEQIKLSVQDSQMLINALNNSPPPSNTLIAAAKRYKKDVSSK